MLIELGDITKKSKMEAIVNPANGVGIMGAGVAGAITTYAGPNVSKEAKELVKKRGRPFEAGDAYATGAYRLEKWGVKKIYHAVTMKYPGGLTSVNVVNRAMRGVIRMALRDGIKSVAFPGLGTGIGRLDKTVVADTMVSVCQQHDHKLEIKIIDVDRDFIEEIKRHVGV